MQFVKTNWPTALAALVVIGIFLLENAGKLTADQVGQVFALLGIGGIAGAQRMMPPGMAAPETTRTHITLPPKGDQ